MHLERLRPEPAARRMNPGLPAAVAEAVVAMPEARSLSTDGVVTWTRGDTAFAVLGSEGIELRLDRPIAAAATRTPDTGPSRRGPEWIRFNPHDLDSHAIDRLTAWLELAYRRAA